ncbi:transcription factor SRM1-like [Sesamum indicum]|uniref:Transcription factor SRM1-like n=1 Tax=Sesamum indicum TaxID=4182 RepID=A0A8M8V239_SESIN|nr:transcription factor SRM1-like [Sesamum indicum]
MVNLEQSVDSATAVWSRQEDKILEQALVEFLVGIDHRWRRIAEFLPGKSPDEVRLHYEALLHDIVEIDSGRVELPGYSDESAPLGWDEHARLRAPGQISFGGGNRSRHSEVERKKGTPWTEDEHRLIRLVSIIIEFNLLLFGILSYLLILKVQFWSKAEGSCSWDVGYC